MEILNISIFGNGIVADSIVALVITIVLLLIFVPILHRKNPG